MHRPPSFRRRSSYFPQLCVAGAILLLLLSLSILHIRLSSSISFPFHSPSNKSSISNNFNPLFDDASNDAFDGASDDLIDVLDDADKLDSDDTSFSSPLFWDHSLGVARISFDRKDSISPLEKEEDSPMDDLVFGSDDQPVDDNVRAKLASIKGIEDVLLLKVGRSLMRDGWAKWIEGKADFIRRDRMLRSDHEMMLNPRNHLLLQDPDVGGFTGLTRGDRMMQKVILKEMDEADLIGVGKKGVEGRRVLHLKVEREEKKWGDFPGIDSRLGFSEFVDRFLGDGLCSIRVFMVWNTGSWSFGVRQRRGVESLLHHHRNACVVLFSETVELDFFKEFVKDG